MSNPMTPDDRNLDDDRWLQTITGAPFYLFDPRPEDFDIEVIAHSLGMQCRFNGHMKRFYSVAEHSVMVSNLLETWGEHRTIQLVGLLHDGAEAYIGDMIRPLKRAIPAFVAVETAIEQSIATAFRLPFPWPDIVKDADNYALAVERAHFLADPPRPWSGLPDVDATLYELPGWGPEQAKREFLARYTELTV